MNHARRIVLTAVSCLGLAATVWANPVEMPKAKPVSTNQQTPAQPQSVSGKIASVEKDSFTLNVASSQTNAPGQTASQPTTAKTMTFVIDKNTTVDGTLKVDSNAEVTYRQDNGANVAISVRVTP
jgi:curli biogenesis system outer membrane secretion channel CsgG